MLNGEIFLEEADKIVSECVDLALCRLGFIDKEAFYKTLEHSYGLKPEDIGEKFEAFHKALKNELGQKHYKVEKYLLETLRQRNRNGFYNHTAEIEAFCRMTSIFMKETDEHIRKIKKLTSIKKYTKHLEQVVEEADARLASNARMAAIGETAAMVGHDLRNPMQTIMNDLYIIRKELQQLPDSKSKQNIQESVASISDNLVYASKIVSDLQDYSRALKPQFAEVDLSNIVKSAFRDANIPRNMSVELNAESSTFKTDPTYIRRALTNLIRNAVEAMPNGGSLTVTAHIKKDNAFITVMDTGEGIPKNVQSDLFKPLFTTKPKGQGLGLAVVKRLVEALDGKVTFETHEGKGTKFQMQIPLPANTSS